MAFTSVEEFDAAEDAGLCDCSVPLDEHPPLAPALPWGHGRPCARTVDERAGQGWGSLSSIKVAPGPGIQITRPARTPTSTTPVARKRYHQVHRNDVLAALSRNDGDVVKTAREVNLSPARVYQIRCAAFGPSRGRR